MSLAIDARHCGAVYVIRCNGRVVAGEELGVMEASINRGLRECRRFVIDVGGVSRVDSTGLGLLVRFLSHMRSRGGDLRLAATQPFLSNLLRATKLTTIFRVYDSEEQAILSFLKEPFVSDREAAIAGPLVLFVDRSVDLGAFVRSLLRNRGYEVLTTCRTRDAKLLLTAAKFDYLVLGPECSQTGSETAVEELKSAAQATQIVQLAVDFKYDDPERAGTELLRMLQASGAANA
jgi:anti-sigma B factor antagonist